ncbi:MAG: hypothetical protein WEE67_01230 [Chloroflexota bacterium]
MESKYSPSGPTGMRTSRSLQYLVGRAALGLLMVATIAVDSWMVAFPGASFLNSNLGGSGVFGIVLMAIIAGLIACALGAVIVLVRIVRGRPVGRLAPVAGLGIPVALVIALILIFTMFFRGLVG